MSETWIVVRACADDWRAEILRGFLESEGIEARLEVSPAGHKDPTLRVGRFHVLVNERDAARADQLARVSESGASEDNAVDAVVTVQQYTDPAAAQRGHAKLRGAGIDAILIEERGHRYAPEALVGVKLQVPEPDAARAYALLRNRPPAHPCPHCGSGRYRPFGPMGLPWIFGLILTAVLPFTRRTLSWQCPDCGETSQPNQWATNPRLRGRQ